MRVSFIYTFTCPDGHTSEGVVVNTIRINKSKLRTTGRGFGFAPRECGTCKAALTGVVTSVRLADDDLTRVNQYRADRGWPAVTVSGETPTGPTSCLTPGAEPEEN